MNKNPFEVRLDVMKMAQEMLDKEQTIKMEKYNAKIRALQQSQTPSDVIIKYIDDAPTMYTSNDILAKASELYNFVNSSTSASVASSATRAIPNRSADKDGRPDTGSKTRF